MREFPSRALYFFKTYKWVFGVLLSLASFGFIYLFFRDQEIEWSLFDKLLWTEILGMSLLLCLPVWLTARVNQSILQSLGEDASFSNCAKALALCQIGKYLPGNVANIIGRVGYLLKVGYGKGNVFKSFLYEHVILVLSGLFCSIFILKKWGLNHQVYIWGLVLGVLFFLLVHFFAKKKWKLNFKLSQYLSSFFILSLNHLILGVVLLWLLSIYGVSFEGGALFFVSVIIFSWLGGFLVPGSPGGIGVREGIILYFLSGSIAPDQLFVIILLQRVFSIIADLINFFIGLCMVFYRRIR